MNTIKCKITTFILLFFGLQTLSAQNNDTCLAFIPPETVEGINMTSVLKGYPGSVIQFDNVYYDPHIWYNEKTPKETFNSLLLKY